MSEMKQLKRARKYWQTKEIFLFTSYLISVYCNFCVFQIFCLLCEMTPPAENNIFFWLMPPLLLVSLLVWLMLSFQHRKEQTLCQLCSLLLSNDWEQCLEIIEQLSLRKNEAEHWSLGFTHLSSLNELWGFGGLGDFYCFYNQKA